MSTQDTADLITSVNNMTETVAGKIGEIDQRVDTAEEAFDNWRATTSFVHKYNIAAAESYSEKDTNRYNLIKIYTITNAYYAINPWIHLGWTGSDVVGSGQFCSLAQSHASYTGQHAMFPRRGNGTVRFFIDRSNQNSAPVYVALSNIQHKNAHVALNVASYMALDVAGQGAVDITTWLANNPKMVEIDLIDITTQPMS